MCEVCKKLEEQGRVTVESSNASIGILGSINTELEMSELDDEYFLGAYSDFDCNDDCFGNCIKINFCPICGRKLGDN